MNLVLHEGDGLDQTHTTAVEHEEINRQPANKLQRDKNLEYYDAEQIIRHVTKTIGLRYVIRLYGYSSDNHTTKAQNTCQNNSWMPTGDGSNEIAPSLNVEGAAEPSQSVDGRQSLITEDALHEEQKSTLTPILITGRPN